MWSSYVTTAEQSFRKIKSPFSTIGADTKLSDSCRSGHCSSGNNGMSGSPMWDQQRDVRKRVFYCLKRPILSSVHPRELHMMEYIDYHFTGHWEGISRGKCVLLQDKWEWISRFPIKISDGNGNNQDVSYSAYVTHSHYLSPTHVILFFWNQIKILSYFPVHTGYFMQLACIYMDCSFCLEFQTECLLVLQIPVQALHPNLVLLDLLEIIDCFNLCYPLLASYHLCTFIALHITLYQDCLYSPPDWLLRIKSKPLSVYSIHMKIQHALFVQLNRTKIIERGSKFIMKHSKSSQVLSSQLKG